MKVFWNKKDVWNKASNIIKLYKNDFLIPKTFIINIQETKNFDFNLLKRNKKYILRPSFKLEDWTNISYAWFFNSIIPHDIQEIKKILTDNDNTKWFWWQNKILLSVIIQEFIETEIYWVYFSRSPKNILKKWFYEIWKKYDDVTSGRGNKKYNLNFSLKKELELLWKKLETLLNFPQNIEFCIQNWKIIILQTRNITTWNNTIYDFSEIIKFNWVYKKLDFDELWDKQDYFSYKVLKNIFNLIYLDWNLYFKSKLIPYFSFRNIKTQNINLILFYKNYKRYLFKKIIFNIIKLFLLQKLNKNILIKFFTNHKYSFLLKNKSNLDLNFDYKTNFITRCFLKLEKQKYIAFSYLEEYKKEYKKNNISFVIL